MVVDLSGIPTFSVFSCVDPHSFLVNISAFS